MSKQLNQGRDRNLCTFPKKKIKHFNFFCSVAHVAHLSMLSFAIRYVPLYYRFSKLRQIETNALQVLHSFADDVIRKRRQELTENPNRVNHDAYDDTFDEIGIRRKRVLLDVLLQSTIDGEPLSDLDIREEVDNFMFGVMYFSSKRMI